MCTPALFRQNWVFASISIKISTQNKDHASIKNLPLKFQIILSTQGNKRPSAIGTIKINFGLFQWWS